MKRPYKSFKYRYVRVERATLHEHLSYFLRPWKGSNLSVQKRQKLTVHGEKICDRKISLI